jgi:Zn-dependent M28 family amino/carboxypeptidase
MVRRSPQSQGVQYATLTFAELEARARAGDFHATPLDATMRLDLAEQATELTSYNLLARLPGTTRPDQTVIYSAHWDHEGKATNPDARGDRIYNGAWDNASGTAGLLEIARAFKAGPAPERSVVFLHVTAEEMGLLGSAWYVRHPVYPLATTAADINIDMLPWSPQTRDVALFGVGKSTLEDTLADLAAQQDRVVTGEGYPQEGFYYRSDHFNFATAGVPAIMPWTGRDLREGGMAAGTALYEGLMARYYHQRADEWRADYDFTAALQNLQLFYRLGLDVADSEGWPQWRPTAEFGGIRAASDDQRR